MIKIGLCTIAYGELELFEVLSLASRVGFDGVEIWGKPPHIPSEYDEGYISQIRKELSRRNLEIPMYGSYLSTDSVNFEKEAWLVLRIAQELGAKIVRIWAGNVGSREADENAWEINVRNLQKLCEIGKEKALVFAMERHGSTLTDTIPSSVQLIERAGAANLMLNYQPAEEETTEDVIDGIGVLEKRIVNVHAHNFGAGANGIETVDFSNGCLNYKTIVDKLISIKFDGFIEIEHVPHSGKQTMSLSEKERKTAINYNFLRQLISKP